MKSNRMISLLVLVAMMFALVGITPALADTVITLTMNAPATNPAIGETFTVDILINATDPIRGIQFDLTWDPAVVRLDESSINQNVWRGPGYFMTCQGPTGPVVPPSQFTDPGEIDPPGRPGLLDAAVTAPIGVPVGYGCTGSGRVATLTFTALANGRSINQFLEVLIPNTSGGNYPPSTPGVRGWEALASPFRVGSGPIIGVTNFSATKVDDTHFTVSFTPTNTGPAPSDETAYTITASNTVEGSASGNIPAGIPNGGTGTPITHNFTLSGGATNSTIVLTIPEFSVNRTIVYVSGVAEQGDVPIDASFQAFLDLSLPAAIDFGFLSLGPNTVDSSLNVKCNASYAVDVTSARAFHMTQWDGTSYGPASLFSALQVVSAQHIVTAPPLPNGARLIDGAVTGQTQDLGQTWPIYLSQVLTYQDPLLPSGQSYHDVLTFNSYVTF